MDELSSVSDISKTKRPSRPFRGEFRHEEPSPQELMENIQKLKQCFENHRMIPSEHLGDVLEIFAFFDYFYEILEGPVFELEELWSCFEYQGPKFLDLIHDIHLAIIQLFMKSFSQDKAKFDSLANDKGYSWFLMLDQIYFKDKIKNQVIRMIWPQLLVEIVRVFDKEKLYITEVQSILSEIDISNYNYLHIKDKIRVLLVLCNLVNELNEVRNVHQAKNENVLELTKRKKEITTEIKTITNEIKEINTEMIETDAKIEQLGNQLNDDSARELPKQDYNRLFYDHNNAKKHKNKLTVDLNRKETKLNKLNKDWQTVKEKLPLCVHMAELLFCDHEDNTFWVFQFDKNNLYMRTNDFHWKVGHHKVDDIISFLSDKEKKQAAFRAKLQNYTEVNVIYNNETMNQKVQAEPLSPDSIRHQIFEYTSSWIDKSKATGLRKQQMKLSDTYINDLYSIIDNTSIEKRADGDFIRELVTYMDNIYTNYLEMRNAFWARPEDKQEVLYHRLDQLNTIEDFNFFIIALEKNFSSIEIENEIDESEMENVSTPESVQEVEPAQKKQGSMEIEQEASESEEIQFRRRRNRPEMIIEEKLPEPKRVITKRSNNKFWHYYTLKLKGMWFNFLPKNTCMTGVVFALLIFCVILIRFIVYRIEKMEEEEERTRKVKEQNMQAQQESLAQYNYQQQEGEFYNRYAMRKKRLEENKVKQRIVCQTCRKSINDEQLVCYSCQSRFHYACMRLPNDGNYTQWRCETCMEKISNSRMTRHLRKQLKFYE